jgi:hypothetical protein
MYLLGTFAGTASTSETVAQIAGKTRPMRQIRLPLIAVLALLAAFCGAAVAQGANPAVGPAVLASLAAQTARRFPQPVRVGDLIGRQVLQPTESQQVLGHVAAIANGPDGVEAIVTYGGFLGFGTHPIAVPIDGLALLGQYVVATGFTPAQLAAFPMADAAATTKLAPDSVIRMGIVGPYH